jgi:NADH dehydrogenase
MNERRHNLVTVLGGSGFLGREIVKRLAREEMAVRVAVRHPESVSAAAGGEDVENVSAVYADVRDETSIAMAIEGAEAVVNAVGLYVERGKETFEAVHGQGALHVARQAGQAGIGRLIHISGIGADPQSESSYVRSRARGEALVQDAFPAVTIFRPSVMFGPGDALFGVLAAIARRSPVIPLFGRGQTRLQPVYVGDVAEAVAQALGEPSSEGKVYELGGPDIYTYWALVKLVLQQLGSRRMLMPVPYPVWDLQARILRFLPNPPLTRDQVALMKRDNVISPGTLTLADLGIIPTPVEAILPTYVTRHRAE